MQALRQFSIPFRGLNEGSHKFEFDLDKRFFDEFADSPLQAAKVKVLLDLEKKSDHLILDFDSRGTLGTECDRCTAEIQLPFSFIGNFIVKYDEDEREEDEVIYIHPESHHLRVAELIHEQLILAIPMIHTYACDEEEPKPCNEKVLDILYSEEEVEESNNPLEDALKNLKITKTK